MKASLIVCCVIIGSCRLCHGFDEAAFLEALAEVESGCNHRAVGKAGERSAWQISKEVWVRFSDKPWTVQNTRNPDLSRIVASRYIASLRKSHKTIRSIACAWNAGPSAKRHSKQTLDFARRVEAIYYSIKNETTI